ncbi:nucleoprotein [Striga asiatica]|uniref:Nucleoprotein n=1 Tax=Striga asiatica TaxID=4170 RepID=A0A5A7PH95_STRAF|nr:nucleoprotein [Striga asiatica]
MNPMMKVSDRNNINAAEIPVKSKAKAVGEIWSSDGREEEDDCDDNRDKPGNEIGSGSMWRAWMAIQQEVLEIEQHTAAIFVSRGYRRQTHVNADTIRCYRKETIR